MASAQLPRRTWCLALLLCLSYLESALVLAQSGDGGAAGGVQPGSLGADSGDQTSAAASGPDTGSANLSHGAVIAIAVVVSLTVVLGTTLAVLFFLAKKRQWKIREGIRRSARKVTNAVKAVATPLTPKKMTFSPVERRMHNAESEKRLKRANDKLNRERDLEKGKVPSEPRVKLAAAVVEESRSSDPVPRGSITSTSSSDDSAKKEDSTNTKPKTKPKLPQVKVPSSSFEIDSPKTPVWKKVFGR